MSQGAFESYLGRNTGGGLEGVIEGTWGGGVFYPKPLPKGRKYAVRVSHPRKMEVGFSRDIIPPPELDDSPPPPPTAPLRKSTAKANQLPPEPLEPICASCLEPLFLAQTGEKRPWGLKCGHVVCGKCIGDAKMRCEEMAAAERKARWTMDIDADEVEVEVAGKGKGKGKELIVLDDEDEDDQDDQDSIIVSKSLRPKTRATKPLPKKSSKGKASKLDPKGKGKSRSMATETGVEENWTTCPVEGCGGEGTDLLAKEGDYRGAFELFV